MINYIPLNYLETLITKKRNAMNNCKTSKSYKDVLKQAYRHQLQFIPMDHFYINGYTHTKLYHLRCKQIMSIAPDKYIGNLFYSHCHTSVKKLTIESIKEKICLLYGNEYSYYSGELINNQSRLIFMHNICQQTFETRAGNFLNGSNKCPFCAHNKKKTLKEIQKIIQDIDDNYEVPDQEYIRSSVPIRILHKTCGREYTACYGDFIEGHRCGHCYITRRKELEVFKAEVFAVVGNEYEVVSKEYLGNQHKILFLHKKCQRIFEVHPNSFLRRSVRCPCRSRSKNEIKIEKFLIDHNIEFEAQKTFDDCVYKYKLHFDFYFKHPVSNVWSLLEYDGEFHDQNIHSDERLQYVKELDLAKTKYCEDNNIPLYRISYKDDLMTKLILYIGLQNRELDQSFEKFLNENNINYQLIEAHHFILPKYRIVIYLQELYETAPTHLIDLRNNAIAQNLEFIAIFEDEWDNKREIIKSKLCHKFNISRCESIYARNCDIKQITSIEKNEFLNKYHLQGRDTSSLYYGLSYKDELVSVITFSKPRVGISSSKYDYELVRFATNNHYRVVGGFSRLLKHFQRLYPDQAIVTFADLRLSNGNLYNQTGFKLTHESKPSYFYIKEGIRYNRFTYRKDRLLELYGGDKELTEKELAEQAGLFRVHDCGTAVYTI